MTSARTGDLSALQKLGLVAFGILLAFLILEASLRLAGFAMLSLQAHRNAVSLQQKGVYRIMCIGESTTQWQYPPVLERILNERNVGTRFSVIDRGLAGAQTSLLLSRLESDLDRYRPHMVMAMMGINDERIRYYADIPESEGILFRHLRSYKLACLLWRDASLRWTERRTDDHIKLGQVYSDRGSYAQAVKQFKQALEMDPRNCAGYAGLGWSYMGLGKLKEAEAIMKEGMARNPGKARLYTELGWMYQRQGRFEDAAKVFSKAVEIRPGYDEVYAGLGSAYQGQRDFAKALIFFGKALELNPRNERVIEGVLWSAYFTHGNLSRLRPLLERIRREHLSMNDKTYAALSMVYSAMGETGLARQAHDQAEELRLKLYAPTGAENYRRLKEILDRRRIRLACVQYPMRSMAPLKKMLQGHEAGIVFIDNQRVFQDAVERNSFETYFLDMFGGDFGHCTSKGNELLAQNIADVLLKEVFGTVPRSAPGTGVRKGGAS